MAGQYLAGKNAGVLTGATVLPFRSWKASMKAVGLKINDFTCGGYQTLIVGFLSAALTLEGAYFAGGTAISCGTVYAFTLQYSPTLNLIISALVTDITPTVDAEKEEVLSVTADSTGAFTAAVT